MTKFRVHYTLTVTGTMEVEADTDEDAGEMVAEDTGYDMLCENGNGLPEIEIEDVERLDGK